jgi:FAD-dependent monooxygenase
MYLVHFKSRDLEGLQKQGQFWHIFFSNGSAIISQDEKDTWTTHLPIPLDTDVKSLDPKEAVYEVLGGSAGKHKIKIDEVLVTSSWRPNLCVADRYRSEKGRVFLAGDSGKDPTSDASPCLARLLSRQRIRTSLMAAMG